MNDLAQLRERAARVLPGGVSSNVRRPNSAYFFERGEGPRLYDAEGRDYLDYLLGQGPAFLGHGHPQINQAVAAAVTKGMVYGAQTRLEVEATEKLLDAIGWADMARLGVSGTESDHAATRLARAVTGRRYVVRFAGQYHGWIDTVLMSFAADDWTVGSAGQLPHYLQDWLVLPFNDVEALEAAFAEHGDDIAAVITEPMMCNSGAIAAQPAFLQRLRQLCTTNGTVLIFDEVITGFRLARGGAAARFGVTPDLAVYGKALAGGWPVSAIAGRRELLEHFGTGRVNHSGTFNASVMAAAAVSATMDVLLKEDPYPALEATGTQLMQGLREVAARHTPMHLQGLPMAFHLSFGELGSDVTTYSQLAQLDLERYSEFTRTLAEHGIWVAGRGIWYVSTAHGARDVQQTLERFDAALTDWLKAGR